MSSLPRLLTGAWVILSQFSISQFYGYSAVTLAENLQKRPNTLPKVSIVVYGRVASQGATSLSITEPPYEVAFERIKGDLGDHFDLRYVQTSAFPCLSALPTNASNADDLAWWYNQRQEADHTFVFITPGGSGLLCDANDASVHAMADNWNTLAFNTVSGLEIPARTAPFSTSLSLTSVGAAAYVSNALTLAARYQWESIFILLDESSVPAFRALALALDKGLRRMSLAKVQFYRIRSTPSSRFHLKQTLWTFGNASRVMFYYGHATQLRLLLITAAAYNMIGEHYVYVATEMMPAPSLYGNLSWFNGDEDDEEARRAFQSLLILQPLDVASQQTNRTGSDKGELLAEFRKRSQRKYNTTYAPGNDLATVLLDSYVAVLLIGQILHETLEERQDLSDGRRLADRFLNRTFHIADFGDVFVDEKGQRKDSHAVAYYDVVSDVRQIFLVEYASSPGAMSAVNGPIPWTRGAWPLISRPSCGYRGDTCPATGSPGLWTGATIGGCMGIGFCAVVLLRWIKHRISEMEPCWILQQHLRFRDENHPSNDSF
ncbi:hypothetical protein BV898_14851 [Hypsibius exemplaris]|uniref:Receptor ligand binding region domain-containing protein n=1 Tax=Hypsibius exemplaris TaxID=2072580 RepID=A0A9X6RJX4_HYPEX|nr:hypothetical protein BV898_14851 [Hypsibius exemplaris]